MSLRKALVMVTILLALGAYVYFVEFAQQRAEAEKKKLLVFDQEAVSAVTLTYPDRTLQLKRDTDGNWRITAPLEAKADPTTVTNLVNAIANVEVTRILEDITQDQDLYGLKTPVAKVAVALKDGTTLPLIAIGKDTPVGFSVYVQKEGDARIFLTPQSFRLGMTKEVKDLRDKTIIAFETEDVNRVEITAPDTAIVLSKGDAGWTLEKPMSTRADEAQVRSFLSSVRGMRAQDFIDQPLLALEEFGLAPPQLAVSLTVGADGAQKTVLIGGEKNTDTGGKQRYVKRGEGDTLFLVGDWVLQDLSKTANDFRDKTVARFARDQVARVEVKRQDGDDFTLTKSEDQTWSINQTHEGTLKQATLNQFVTDLHELRGFEIAADNPSDLAAYGLQNPAVTLTVFDGTGAKLAAIHAGQTTEGEVKKAFAIAEGGSTVFALRDYVFDRVNKKSTDFWEKPAAGQDDAADTSSQAKDLEEEPAEEEEED